MRKGEFNPSRPVHLRNLNIKIKINLNFYFHTSFWCIKKFYEGLNLIYFFLFVRDRGEKGLNTSSINLRTLWQ